MSNRIGHVVGVRCYPLHECAWCEEIHLLNVEIHLPKTRALVHVRTHPPIKRGTPAWEWRLQMIFIRRILGQPIVSLPCEMGRPLHLCHTNQDGYCLCWKYEEEGNLRMI